MNREPAREPGHRPASTSPTGTRSSAGTTSSEPSRSARGKAFERIAYTARRRGGRRGFVPGHGFDERL